MNREIYSNENEGDKPQTNEPPKGNPHPSGRGGGQFKLGIPQILFAPIRVLLD
jgi:hypothetical protein